MTDHSFLGNTYLEINNIDLIELIIFERNARRNKNMNTVLFIKVSVLFGILPVQDTVHMCSVIKKDLDIIPPKLHFPERSTVEILISEQ